MLVAPTTRPLCAFHTATGSAFFSHSAPRLPRVWGGHGLALPADQLAGFTAALSEVMKLPAYWIARHACPDKHAGDAERWTRPRLDDGLVYVDGPCDLPGAAPGYHPAAQFTIALPHVRGLRIRLSAYLKG